MEAGVDPIIVVHGGAGAWSRVFEAASRYGLGLSEEKVLEAVAEAARTGFAVLESGGSAVDAVVEAVRYMEDSGVFNAGVASALDASGGICMDAGVMDGETLRAGAVACVRYPRNPVILARRVMDLTDHVILCCEWADRLAERLGLPRHPGPHPRALSMWRAAKEALEARGRPREWWRRNSEAARILGILDTVGAVALDSRGRVAAAVSTGGVNFKLPGRVGDSCVPGAGFYARSDAGAAAATGLGEAILVSMLSGRAVELMRQGATAAEAARAALSALEDMTGSGAGLIVIDRRGGYAVEYNTEAMPYAIMKEGGESPITGLWRS